MKRRRRSRSALSITLTVIRTVLILAGIALLGRWVVDSIGGYIHVGYLATALGLFVASYLLSILF